MKRINIPSLFLSSCCAAALGSAVLAGPAAAQITQQQAIEIQGGIADPGRLQDDLRRDRAMPGLGADIEIKQMQLVGAPEGAENIRFVLGRLEIDGLGVYSEADLQPIYADKVGTEISLAELYEIANRITLKYRNSGYILTQVVIPPQTIEGGTARVQIVEGYVHNVTIQADTAQEGPALDLIRSYAEHIRTGTALNARTLERHLLLINDLPGVSARGVLSPSPDTPGASDVTIIVERDPYEALLGVNNYGSRYLGPVNLTASGTANSMLRMNEALTGQVVVAPDSGYELAYGALAYEQPIGPWGTKVTVFGSVTDTDPGYDLEEFDVRGHSNLYSVQLRHPFIRSRSENLYGHLLFDWRDVESSNNIENTREDRIRAARAGLGYEFLDTLIGVAFNAIELEVSKGLDILGASEEGRGSLTRDRGDPQFTKITAEFQRLQRLSGSVNLLMAGRGQLSDGPLLASEEFGVGGFDIGRAFDSSEIVGDEGMSGKAELQWNNPFGAAGGYVEKTQVYSFFDAGRVWNDDATTSSTKSDTLTSAGAGFRVNFTGGTEADFALAFPLNRDVQTQKDDDPRAYFSLVKKF